MARSPMRTRQNCSRSSYALLRLQLKNFYKFLQKEFTWTQSISYPTTDPDYSVIWIPGATRDLALHKLRTMSHGLSLVRMRQRHHMLTIHEASARAELRPATWRQLHQGQCPEGLPPPSTPARTLEIVCQTTATCARHF